MEDYIRTVANLRATTNLELEEAGLAVARFANISGTESAGFRTYRFGDG